MKLSDHHAWNTFYTVLPSGKIQGTIIDSTWADKKGKDMKNPDYTDERFLFNLERMVIEGLLTQEEKIINLEIWCEMSENKRSPSYKSANQEIGDYYERQGNKEECLAWYMKEPSIKDLARIQENYDIPESVINTEIQKLMTDENLKNPKYALFFTEYFYKNGEYAKVLEFGVKILKRKNDKDIGVLFCIACIKTKKTNFNGYTPKAFCTQVKDWMEKNIQKKQKLSLPNMKVKKTKKVRFNFFHQPLKRGLFYHKPSSVFIKDELCHLSQIICFTTNLLSVGQKFNQNGNETAPKILATNLSASWV